MNLKVPDFYSREGKSETGNKHLYVWGTFFHTYPVNWCMIFDPHFIRRIIFFFIGVAWCILSVNLNTIFTFPLSYYLLPPPLLSIRCWSQIFFGILILDTKLYESIPFDTICWTLIRQFGNNWYAFSTATRLSIKLAVWLDSPIYYDYSDSGSRFGTICFRQTCSYVL